MLIGACAQVMLSKDQYNKLRQEYAKKEQERDSIRSTLEELTLEVTQLEAAEQDLQDFAGRVEARIAHHDTVMPEMRKSQASLEEVMRRLNVVNKGLNFRLTQARDDLRQFHVEHRQLVAANKEIQLSREATVSACEAFKVTLQADRQKCNVGLMRLQAEVETALQETRQRALQLKTAEEEREYEQAEAEAEEELARIRAIEDGQDYALHLKAIRERRRMGQPIEADPAKEACVKRVFEAARARTADEALGFLSTAKERNASLTELQADLENRVQRLRSELHAKHAEEDQVVRAERAREAPADHTDGASKAQAEENVEAIEQSLQEIAAYADSSRLVCEMMTKLFAEFMAWAVKMLGRLVRVSQEDAVIRRVLVVSRGRPAPSDFDAMRKWQQDVLALLADAWADFLYSAFSFSS